jgi:iron complex outermembrane recepter protein
LRFGLAAFCLLAFSIASSAQETDEAPLEQLSLEELLHTEVSSVLKHASDLTDAPAATTVIRREDIERSAATSLPDLLRTVPGLAVARIDGNRWAISARGFNGFFGSKLLIMIDGRSIYNSIYSGIFWDANDIPLDNISRIEIVRGPVAALWGSNAINGVINIVTRSAQETVGGNAEMLVGSRERLRSTVRGGGHGEGSAWRVYVQSGRSGETELASGNKAGDTAYTDRVGFRADSAPDLDSWMLTGEAYEGKSGGAPYPEPTDTRQNGYHLLGRRIWQLDGSAQLQLQTYFDHAWRQELANDSVLRQDVYDIEAQYSDDIADSHHLSLGSGWRQYSFTSNSSSKLAFVPGDVTQQIANVFVQDEWSLRPNLQLISALRLETIPRQGVAWQPSLRAVWTVSPRNTLWTAASRAVRSTNMVETRIHFTGPGVGGTTAIGNLDFEPEEAESLEAGWRSRLSARVNSDLSLYTSRHRLLQTIEPISANEVSYFNHGRGNTAGLEWALDYQANDIWQLRGGLTLYRESLSFSEAVPAGSLISFQSAFPSRQLFVRSLWDLGNHEHFDITLRGVGPMHARGVTGYGAVDLSWGMRPLRNLGVTFNVRNLFSPKHVELADQPYFLETIVEPEAAVVCTVNF